MRRALQGQATDRAPKVLTPIQQVVPRIWLELSQPAQQQLAQLMARLLLRMRQPDNRESPAARLYSLIRSVYQTRHYLQYKAQKARHSLAESEVANG